MDGLLDNYQNKENNVIEALSDPASGPLIGIVIGGLIAGFFTLLVQRDKSQQANWKDLSTSAKEFREDLINRLETVQRRLDLITEENEKIKKELEDCHTQHTEATKEIARLKSLLEQYAKNISDHPFNY